MSARLAHKSFATAGVIALVVAVTVPVAAEEDFLVGAPDEVSSRAG